jgi:outer membrane lipoprotein SlyB
MKLRTVGSILVAAGALGLAGCETPATPAPVAHPQATHPGYPAHVARFGTVESIQTVQIDPQATGIGAIGGAVAGGVLGREVIGGTGGTVGGAVVGGAVGHGVERHVRGARTGYQFVVRMDDGTRQTFVQETHGNVRVGDRVRVQDGVVYGY